MARVEYARVCRPDGGIYMKMWLSWALSVSGAALIIAGVAMVFIPAAVILAGCAVLAAGALLIDVTE